MTHKNNKARCKKLVVKMTISTCVNRKRLRRKWTTKLETKLGFTEQVFTDLINMFRPYIRSLQHSEPAVTSTVAVPSVSFVHFKSVLRAATIFRFPFLKGEQALYKPYTLCIRQLTCFLKQPAAIPRLCFVCWNLSPAPSAET